MLNSERASAVNAPDHQLIMSEWELAVFGLRDIAYVRQVVVDGRSAYSIHAADGTALGVADDRDLAFAAVRQHDLEPLSVH